MDTRKRRKEGGTSQSLVFESLHSLPKRAKVHAQRKFAQGTQPNSPAVTPVKEFRELRDRIVPTECRTRLNLTTQSVITTHQQQSIVPSLTSSLARPKTEDFLTFLCFRRTALLPPELEFFETPQLLENSVDSSHGITPPHDDKSSKSFKKKEEFGFENEKKAGGEFSDSIKKNIEQEENEIQTPLPSTRVTRSSASLTPTPSFLSSPPSSDCSPQDMNSKRKLSRKQILLKKAMLIKKSNTLNARRHCVRLRGKSSKRRSIITRANSTSEGSPTLNLVARKNNAKRLFMKRNKEQLSRILKRLGTPLILSPSEKGRVTRSRIEVSEEAEKDDFTKHPKSKPSNADEVLVDMKETKPLMEEGSDGNKKPQKESEKVEVLQEKCKNTSPRQSLKLLKNLSCKEVLRKRKLNLVDKRVTRRLIYNKEKKVEVNEGETVAENTMKLRCKRSVSDALVSETKSSAGTKNIVPERSKSTDSRSSESSRKNLREKSLYNETVEEPEPPSLRNRPSRKTKRVAEVYLELISQRLAKESQKGRDLSDEDIEEDNISISSIKELKTLSKTPKNKELNVEKCVQELVERHQGKEPKVSTSDSKEKEPQNIITKSASVKQNLNQAQNPVQNPQSTDDSRRMELRSSDVIFDSIVNYEENNSTNSKKKAISNTLSLKKSRSSKSSDSDSPPVLGKRRESLLSRLGRGSKSPKQITPVHNDKSPVVLRSSSHSPSPQSQRKIVEHVSPKEPPYQTRSSEIQKEVQISPKGLRRRASAECPKIDKKETVRRLSYDPKPLKNQVESCEINTLSLNLRKRESRKVPVNARKSNDLEDETACESDNSISYTSKCSKPSNLTTEKSKIKIEETLILSDTPLNIKENSTIHATEAPESSTKEKEKLVLNLPTENIKPKEENNLGSATDTVKSVPRFSKKNSKPKRLPLSPRFKRTLSLGSEQSSSQNCDQLRKCGSEESVVKSCSNKELSKTTELLTLSTSVQSGNSVQHKSNVAKDIKQKGNEILSQVRKPIFSRRRSSIHDEAKLNAVLESVAKDFEKDMDDQLFDKIEKDLNAGNKSPDKTNKSFLETLKSKQPLLTEKESSTLNIDINSRSSPVTQSSSSSSSPVPTRKSSNSKKLCDVVRNLQERKQAESPHSFNDSATPSFLQDLKSLDSRSLDKPKQVSEEAVVMQPFDLALAPNISHSTDSDNSLVTLNSTTHSCTSDHKKAPEDIFIKSIKCSDDRKEMVNNQNDSSPSEKESVSPLTVPSIESKQNSVLSINNNNNNNNNNNSNNNNNNNNNKPNVALTTFVPFPSVTADPLLNIPFTNTNIIIPKVALNTRPMSSVGPASNLSVNANHLTQNLMSTRFTPLGHGMSLTSSAIPQAAVIAEANKASKSDQSKNNSKQILIAPKPSRTISSPALNPTQGISTLKNSPKPIQIAPKLPCTNSSGSSASANQLHPSSPVIPVSQMGHVLQGVPHQVQAMQPIPQALSAVQAISQGVQPLQAITQNFPTITGMTSAVQAVITQTMALNHNQLVTPSNPGAKIITQPVFVTSSMPNMMSGPFDIAMQNNLHSNVGAVARVVAQNVVGKVNPKSPQVSLVSSGAQSLVTLAPGSIETNVMPSIVPFHQPGQPAQFVAVNMMPVAPPQISLQSPRHLSSTQMGPILCPQPMTCISSASGVPAVSTPLNLIPPGSIVTCPLPDVNSGICNSNIIQPLQCVPANSQATKPVDTFLPETVSSSSLALAQSSSLKSPPEELKNSNTNCTENADESSESHEPLVIEEENDNSENSKNDDNIPLDESVFPKSLTSMKDQIIQSNDLSESNNIIKVHGKEHKIVSERKSSFIPSIPPVVTSPVVSQALSKLFPVAEPLNNVSFLGNKPISLSSSQTTSSSCSQSNDALVKPPISHMIFSNFVYTTTSIVIPKMLDQSMTSPKAVTKVSQSSPPYVLSTSTSNEMPVKSSKINTKANLNTLKDNSIPALKSSLNQHLESGTLPDSNLNTLQNDSVNSTTELETNLVDESICKASEPSVAKILDNLASSVTVSIFPKVQTTISPTCISSVPEKQNDNKLNANIFYSNQSNRVKIQSDRNKHNHPFTTSASHITNFAQDKSEKIALMNSKNLNENKSSKNRPVCSSVVDVKEKKGKDLNHINHFHQSQNILDINQPHTLDNLCKKVQSKSKVLESRNEKKREPILKKTLFKNKNSIDKKTSDAFSPLNESSVYAFEPDTEPPLEMTSPFSQRIKKIHPSPSVSGSKSKLPLTASLQNSKEKIQTKKSAYSLHSVKNDSNKINKAVSKIVKTPCHTEASTPTTCLTSTTNVNKVQNAVKNSTVTNVVSVVPTKLTSHAITSSALKASNKLPFVNNKVNTSCTAHSSNIKSSSVNNILSTSSRKPITSQIPPNCNTLQLKEITAEIRIIKNQEQDIGSGKTVSLASKSPKEKINLTESKDKEKIYEKERKLDNILPRICSSENITEDNIPQVNLKDLESESNDSEDLDIAEVNISEVHTKATNSTSIAIQCDLDDSMSEKSQDGLKGSESGTQTEGPSKFPLPPSASPFYYLPLAMATLGEKLPAQLVQQMLAKTQGLVGAAEAGLILQQAAQLAQQYHKSSDDEGTMSDSPSPAVKPISPKSGSIALQKALKANLASIAQAEISVAQSSGIHLNSVSPQPFINNLSDKKDSENSKNSHIKGLFVRTNSLPEYEEADANILLIEKSSKSTKLDTSVFSENEKSDKLEEKTVESEEKEDIETEVKVSKPDTDERDDTSIKSEKSNVGTKSRGKRSKVPEVAIKRRSGRSSTLAATKATESDLLEIEEMRRNRRAKRAAAILAKEESWSSSSEAPLSPIMSPDMLRGWPPPRLTSPTPSQSSEGTNASSSTVSQRSSRMSGPHSRRHSPASSAESSRRHSRYSTSSNNAFSTDPVLEPGPLRVSENPNLTRAPSFFPSEEEFTDPLDYIEKIRPEAEQFGLCRIVPPSNFRPECRVNDDMRFTAYKQYIHRMMKRWGPNDRTLCAIKKCLTKQNIELSSIPVIGGIELDLVQLYNVVENHGGLMKVIEKELWSKVADALKVPKSGQDRLTKLDSIYCKYLLPFSTLSKEERESLLEEVDAIHNRTQSDESSKKSGESSDDDDDEEEPLECMIKGKSTALSAFYRIARNIAGQWQPDPSGLQMDERYWEVVRESENYLTVHTASIDTSEHGYGFPSQKTSPNAKHPWNLKNLCQNTNSVLRSMGKVIGVTAPTLHVGMMFSTVCWYRDPHSLPWIEYLHTGACKIWYGVSSSNEEKFRTALIKLVPDFIKSSPLWLPSDTAMVPPEDLIEEGVKVCRVVQEPGQFVVVFPGAFTSSVCSGYLISESAFFARPQYFDRAMNTFQTLTECCEPSMFSLDRLALSVASDAKATQDALLRVRQVVTTVVDREKRDRQALLQLGLTTSERLSSPNLYRKRKNRYADDEEEVCCEICRQHLYVSLVTNTQEETVYCPQHAAIYLTNNLAQLPLCKIMYTYSLPELTSILKQVDERIQTKTLRKHSASSNKKGTFDEQDSFSSTSSSNF